MIVLYSVDSTILSSVRFADTKSIDPFLERYIALYFRKQLGLFIHKKISIGACPNNHVLSVLTKFHVLFTTAVVITYYYSSH